MSQSKGRLGGANRDYRPPKAMSNLLKLTSNYQVTSHITREDHAACTPRLNSLEEFAEKREDKQIQQTGRIVVFLMHKYKKIGRKNL
jgi:hypothetical protein